MITRIAVISKMFRLMYKSLKLFLTFNVHCESLVNHKVNKNIFKILLKIKVVNK